MRRHIAILAGVLAVLLAVPLVALALTSPAVIEDGTGQTQPVRR